MMFVTLVQPVKKTPFLSGAGYVLENTCRGDDDDDCKFYFKV